MVSVVMASYNAKMYIKEQIETIFNNISENDELIIVDDNSTDGTFETLQSISDKHQNIKLYRNDSNIGVNNTFEKALGIAAGDFIVISDDDDVWFDDKIKKVMPYFTDDNILMVVHDCILIDEENNVLNDSYFTLRNAKTGLLRTILKPCYRGATMCFRRKLLSKVLPFPKKLDMFYDEWISIMAEKYGKVILHKEALSKWRRISKSVSSINIESEIIKSSFLNKLFKQIKHRLKKIIMVIYR